MFELLLFPTQALYISASEFEDECLIMHCGRMCNNIRNLPRYNVSLLQRDGSHVFVASKPKNVKAAKVYPLSL